MCPQNRYNNIPSGSLRTDMIGTRVFRTDMIGTGVFRTDMNGTRVPGRIDIGVFSVVSAIVLLLATCCYNFTSLHES